jgi:hypothetical protein
MEGDHIRPPIVKDRNKRKAVALSESRGRREGVSLRHSQDHGPVIDIYLCERSVQPSSSPERPEILGNTLESELRQAANNTTQKTVQSPYRRFIGMNDQLDFQFIAQVSVEYQLAGTRHLGTDG